MLLYKELIRGSQDSLRESNVLTLTEAKKTGKIQDFIAQQERLSLGSTDQSKFDTLAEKLIKTPQSTDQTSGSLRRGGSAEK